jgi:glutaredoxin
MTKMFTAAWCAPCSRVKEVMRFLEHDVELVDVGEDSSELKALGIRTIPTILTDLGDIINGELEVISFLRATYEKNLQV